MINTLFPKDWAMSPPETLTTHGSALPAPGWTIMSLFLTVVYASASLMRQEERGKFLQSLGIHS